MHLKPTHHLLLAFLLFTFQVQSQDWDPNTAGQITYTGGKVGIGTTAPINKLHVANNSISLAASALYAEQIALEATDAGLGIYSTDGGNFGSRLILGEVSGGSLANKWGIIRTTGSDSELRFYVGSNADIATNSNVLTIRNDTRTKLSVSGGIELGKPEFNTISGSSSNSWVRDTWLTSNYGNITWNESLGKWTRGSGSYNDIGGIIWQDEGTYFIREPNGTKLEYTNSEFLNLAFMYASISSGYVGIGTNSPSEKLTVGGNASIFEGDIIFNNSAINQSESGTLRWNEYSSTQTISGASIKYNGQNNFLLLSTNTESANYEHFKVFRGGNMILQPNSGNVGIGTSSPDEKLTVKGTIHSEEVKVDLSVPGPDYVFESDYDLRTLQETEAYINAHKHLPEIPSAKEMEANGLELGKMNMLLLKKIEELTLYQIQLLKKLEEQNERIENQQEEIQKLKNKVK